MLTVSQTPETVTPLTLQGLRPTVGGGVASGPPPWLCEWSRECVALGWSAACQRLAVWSAACAATLRGFLDDLARLAAAHYVRRCAR